MVVVVPLKVGTFKSTCEVGEVMVSEDTSELLAMFFSVCVLTVTMAKPQGDPYKRGTKPFPEKAWLDVKR
jgi:hypothetical protein